MEPLLSAMLNAGGMGVLSAALFFLHRESLKSSNERADKDRESHDRQLKEERETHDRQLREERESCDKRHAELLKRFDSAHAEEMEEHRQLRLMVTPSHISGLTVTSSPQRQPGR